MFPETPQTLLKKIAELAEGDDQAEWTAFVELYTMPVRNFIRSVNQGLSPSDVEDAVQEIFIRLVNVLRKEKIDRKKGKFRDYLAVLTRRLLIDRYRAALCERIYKLSAVAQPEFKRGLTEAITKSLGIAELEEMAAALAKAAERKMPVMPQLAAKKTEDTNAADDGAFRI